MCGRQGCDHRDQLGRSTGFPKCVEPARTAPRGLRTGVCSQRQRGESRPRSGRAPARAGERVASSPGRPSRSRARRGVPDSSMRTASSAELAGSRSQSVLQQPLHHARASGSSANTSNRTPPSCAWSPAGGMAGCPRGTVVRPRLGSASMVVSGSARRSSPAAEALARDATSSRAVPTVAQDRRPSPSPPCRVGDASACGSGEECAELGPMPSPVSVTVGSRCRVRAGERPARGRHAADLIALCSGARNTWGAARVAWTVLAWGRHRVQAEAIRGRRPHRVDGRLHDGGEVNYDARRAVFRG